jgi:hypothetical protein
MMYSSLLLTGIQLTAADPRLTTISLPVWQWLPADVNQGYMMYYFFLLAGIQLVDLLIFIWVASGYQYKNLEEEEEQPSTGAQSTEASMRIHHRAMSELHE